MGRGGGTATGQRERAADCLEVDRLAARHAARAASPRQELQHRELVLRILGEGVLGEELEGEALQRISGEERRRLVELDVARGLAPAQRIVVHARQIVVDQRVRMDHLDGRGARIHAGDVGIDDFAGRVSKQRTHALAAAERRVAHRRRKARRR